MTTLKSYLSNIEGGHVSVGKIIRCSSILGSKILDPRSIQIAIRILFSGNIKNQSISSAVLNLSRYTNGFTQKSNDFQKIKNKLKCIISQFGFRKMDDNVIFYLEGIYDNISDYVLEEMEFHETTITIQEFIEKCILVSFFERAKRLKEKHFHCLHQILSPNIPITLIWNMEKTKENINTIIQQFTSDIQITDSFFLLLINYKILE